MAQKLGISQQMYSKYENEQSDPSLSKLMDMARALGLSVVYFLATETVYHLKVSEKDCELLDENYCSRK
jgi:transcriptional regulator with XRE-family HTH domain